MAQSLKNIAKTADQYLYVLLVMRHAKTEPANLAGDRARELTDKGRKQAKNVARGIQSLRLVPDRIACSGAVRAQQTLVDAALANDKIIPVMSAETEEIRGDDLVTSIVFSRDGKRENLAVDGVFIFVGYTPNTDYCGGLADTDNNGRLITDEHYQCAQPGLYAIGDVRSKEVFQIANAVGEGAAVVHAIQQYLKETDALS